MRSLEWDPSATSGSRWAPWWGSPLVAAEPRVRVAVLGLMGAWGPNAQRLVDDAGRISCPVRFLVQWDDELVPRDRALELFDLLGAREKALRAHPGRHVEVPSDEMRDIPGFLAAHLCRAGGNLRRVKSL